MYPQSTVDIARQLSDLGILDRENAQICGVSIRSMRFLYLEEVGCMHVCPERFEALAVPVPTAWSRAVARAPHRA